MLIFVKVQKAVNPRKDICFPVQNIQNQRPLTVEAAQKPDRVGIRKNIGKRDKLPDPAGKAAGDTEKPPPKNGQKIRGVRKVRPGWGSEGNIRHFWSSR